MLIINSSQVEKLADPIELVQAIKKCYEVYESGQFNMPQRMHVHHNENTLLLMPCFSGDRFSTKLISVFPGNIQKGRPAIYGNVILNDGKTGEPLAMINGERLTAFRTGAVGGMAILKLSPNATKVGVVGAGKQGFYQALFAASLLELKELRVFDNNVKTLQIFSQDFKQQFPDIKLTITENTVSLVEHSEVIITATSSITPVLPDEPALLKGKTFISIGSYRPDMQELPDSLFQLVSQYFIDTTHAKNETGDIKNILEKGLISEEKVIPFSKLATGNVGLDGYGTKVFKSVGMALFDLEVANFFYKKAVGKGVGTHCEA